jgi:hypothetical protein
VQETLTVLADTDAQRLARRLAGARGIPWPAGPMSRPAPVSGVGGFTARLTHVPGREELKRGRWNARLRRLDPTCVV